jgi:hypothetical protein
MNTNYMVSFTTILLMSYETNANPGAHVEMVAVKVSDCFTCGMSQFGWIKLLVNLIRFEYDY